MPHTEYINNPKFGLVDFRIELYPISIEEKSILIKSFYSNNGFVGYTNVVDIWLFFNREEVRKATEEEIENLPHLPDYWEDDKYLLNIHAPV